jgi:hypothetical protein
VVVSAFLHQEHIVAVPKILMQNRDQVHVLMRHLSFQDIAYSLLIADLFRNFFYPPTLTVELNLCWNINAL